MSDILHRPKGRSLKPLRELWPYVRRYLSLFILAMIMAAVVGTGAIARPGVTGDKVPGATEYGPTRPVPHLLPTLMGTPGASRAPAQGRPNESTSAGAGQPAKTGEHE